MKAVLLVSKFKKLTKNDLPFCKFIQFKGQTNLKTTLSLMIRRYRKDEESYARLVELI